MKGACEAVMYLPECLISPVDNIFLNVLELFFSSSSNMKLLKFLMSKIQEDLIRN